MKIGVVSKVKVREGQGSAFETLFLQAKALALKTEPGLLVYEMARCEGYADQYVSMQLYSDEAAQAAHGRGAALVDVNRQLMPLFDGAPDMQILQLI